ncbi:hypothetical protein GQ457_14G025320 [Hibiscus cannabinus]
MTAGDRTILQFIAPSTTSLWVKVHPLTIFNICECYVRRPDQAERVIGTILGMKHENCYELSYTMDRRSIHSHGRIVIPIFYHINPSHVGNFGGSFKASFEKHEKTRPVDQVKRWKAAFAKVSEIPGWHIKGGKVDRPETEYIEKIVDDVTKKLMTIRSRSSTSEGLVGIDDQIKTILGLLEEKDYRVIGLWGMCGIGKTTLAEVVYNKISSEISKFYRDSEFQRSFFLQNVSEKIKKQGKESLRNDLLSKVLNEKEIRIDTPNIGSPYLERLNNMRIAAVFDDLSHPDQIDFMDFMGVTHFGNGSKIIVTSGDRQVLKNVGADKIHEVEKLDVDDSLQLFSTFAFKQLNPDVNFRDLSNKFLEYAQGNPLALKVLGFRLYKKFRKEWESEIDKLKEYGQPEIYQILKSSFDELDEPEKNIFLDIACFFKGEPMKNIENILSCLYKGAVSGMSNLVDKHLLDISPVKDIPGTDRIEGMKLDMSQIDNLKFFPTVFEKMYNLRYINFYFPLFSAGKYKKLHADQGGILSLPNELSLNQDSIDNIVANAMLKIGSMTEKWAKKCLYGPKRLICCFPRTEIPPSKFEYQSVNSSLILKMDPNRCSGSRYLVFSICLVVDLTYASKYEHFECSIRLTAADGGCRYLNSGWFNEIDFQKKREYAGDHVLVLFSSDMIRKDEGFEEASFKFYGDDREECYKVEKCGVHVSYVDAESVDEVYATMEKKRIEDLIPWR